MEYSDLNIGNISRPQEGRTEVVRMSIDALNEVEFARMNRILTDDRKIKQETILDKPLGEVINNLIYFLGNSVNSYHDKMLESEVILNLKSSETMASRLKIHLTAMSLFIRDDEHIIYLGLTFIIIAFIISILNITRGKYGPTTEP